MYEMRPWYRRKKTWATVLGIASVVATSYFGVAKEDALQVTGLIMAYLFAQGKADSGNGKK